MDIFLVAIQLNYNCVYKIHTMPKLAIRYTQSIYLQGLLAWSVFYKTKQGSVWRKNVEDI
jgi:hypothetical protein